MQQPSPSPAVAADITETRARLTSALASALAPLGPFLEDARVVEIMLNADGVVWIDRIGEGMVRTDVRMERVPAEAMLRLVAADVGVQLTASSPALAAKLPPPWAARLQAFLPPVVDAPVFALRKPPRIVFSLPDYLRAGILTTDQSRALVGAIHRHENILIGGSTGSGKTTFANALLRVVADAGEAERLYIIEDTPELQCSAPNKLQILVQSGALTWRDAVMAAMRVRPDRIIVGEIRDGSALELLKAWNTGHPGGLATIHANDTRGTLDRFCQLLEEVVYPAPRALVAQTIHLCVHITRDPEHPAGRRVSGVDRVVGLAPDGGWLLESASPSAPPISAPTLSENQEDP
jgi:type IV secretion system protein VirB11